MAKPAKRASDSRPHRDAGSVEHASPSACALGHVTRAPIVPSQQTPDVARRITLMPDVSAGMLELFRALIDRKSTRLNLQSRLHLVCRLLLEKKKRHRL